MVGKAQTVNIDDDEEEEEEDENDARAPNTRADVDAGIGAKIKGNQNKKGAKVQPFGEQDRDSRGNLVNAQNNQGNNMMMQAMMMKFQQMMAQNKGNNPA